MSISFEVVIRKLIVIYNTLYLYVTQYRIIDRDDNITQWGKELAVKPENLTCIPSNSHGEERTLTDFHMYTTAYISTKPNN